MLQGIMSSLGLIRELYWLIKVGYSYLEALPRRRSILVRCLYFIIQSLGLKRLTIILIFINIILIFLCLISRFSMHIIRSYSNYSRNNYYKSNNNKLIKLIKIIKTIRIKVRNKRKRKNRKCMYKTNSNNFWTTQKAENSS